MVQTSLAGPETASHPTQPPKVEPLGAAVNVTVVPGGKSAVQVVAQPSPEGELEIVPAPFPAKPAEIACPVGVKQTTLAVMKPVTIAPEAVRLPSLLVCKVAETRAFPQVPPVAASTPFASTVTIAGVFDVQTTFFVMSLVTGG